MRKGIIVVISIIILVIGMWLVIRNMSSEEEMSREEIIELVRGGLDLYSANYSHATLVLDRNTTKHKGNIFISTSEEGTFWIDVETEEVIEINHIERKAEITSGNHPRLLEILVNEILPGDIYEILKNEEFEFEFVDGDENNDFIVVQLSRTGEIVPGLSTRDVFKVWIAKDTGVISRVKNGFEREILIWRLEVEFNVVTEEDIVRPDLDGYEVVDHSNL
ncbi:MAG: hypothetical protein FWC79_01725 [Oscillospiraceae bacterium]|nr:hypothetical protein [Oscillospiraceae bacterium]